MIYIYLNIAQVDVGMQFSSLHFRLNASIFHIPMPCLNFNFNIILFKKFCFENCKIQVQH
jgi:hypothetical protein